MRPAYYNEIEPYCVAWLRNLISAGHIPAGDVDERDIREVLGDDLEGYGQIHLFAGIGGWAYACRLAGVPDDYPVWTGSCPCQPLSSAGQRRGHADERHLWPAFYRLVAERAPAMVFGEQVASKDGREWLAAVRADLERLGYAVGAADLPAAGVGAPHIRQRLWWVAHADGGNASAERLQGGGEQRQQPQNGGIVRAADDLCAGLEGRQIEPARQKRAAVERSRRIGGLDDAAGARHESARGGQPEQSKRRQCLPTVGRQVGGLCDAALDGWRQGREIGRGGDEGEHADKRAGPVHAGQDFWSAYDIVPCADGKARRVEPGSFPLAHGIPRRVGRLRAYGNAIVPQVAAEFMKAALL